MTLLVQCLCFDAEDPAGLARWWAELLGGRITEEEPEKIALEPPAGSKADGVVPDLLFLEVPEGKAGEVRVGGVG